MITYFKPFNFAIDCLVIILCMLVIILLTLTKFRIDVFKHMNDTIHYSKEVLILRR